MSATVALANGRVFAPVQIRSLNLAYENALDVLKKRPLIKKDMDDQLARVEVAKALLEIAKTGECDPSRLGEKALFHLSVVANRLDSRA